MGFRSIEGNRHPMDYSVNPWWVYVIAVVGVFAIVIGLPLLLIAASSRRSRRQSLSIENGTVSIIDSAFGGAKTVPIQRIGTVVYLPEREADSTVAPVLSAAIAARNEDYRITNARGRGSGAEMFTHGGLILLDTRGRMLGHVAYEVGSHAPLGTVWRQIPAQNYVQAPLNAKGTAYSRSAFKRAYPRALRLGQLWSSARWLWTVLVLVFVGIPVAAFIAVFIWAFVTTWQQMYG